MSSSQNHFEDTDTATQTLRNGARIGRRTARHAIDLAADRAAGWRNEVAPVADRLTARATDAAKQGADWVREHGDRVRTQVARASDRTVGYARQQPVKTALIVVAAGVLAYAVSRLFAERDDR